MRHRIRALHVISDLMTGGAEMMLLKLLTTVPPSDVESSVVSLLSAGTIGPQLSVLNVPVRALGLSLPTRAPAAIGSLRKAASRRGADVVVGWMYHGNIAASVAALLSARGQVVWNVRHSVYRLSDEKPATRAMIRLGALISSTPSAIVYNSHASRDQHERLGYAARHATIIPNGFDTRRFAPDPAARQAVRAELGLPPESPVIGLIGRYHPMKDHENFLVAASKIRFSQADARFVLAGRDVDGANQRLAAVVRDLDLGGCVTLLGERSDVPRLCAAMDIAVSASWSEAMPNAIGEAMSCGVPCVVTDVGDSGRMVADTGFVVPPRDSQALADACVALLAQTHEHRVALGRAARARILREYDVDDVGRRFADLWRAVGSDSPAQRRQ